LLFGRDRVPRWAYFASTLMVALGTTFSAFWIMANNTWMQVPMGYAGRRHFVPTDWAEILFNDVLWVRFPHMLLGAYLTTAFCVAATGAWYLLAPPPPQARVDAGDGAWACGGADAGADRLGHFNGEYTAAAPARASSPPSRAAGRPSSRHDCSWPGRTSQRAQPLRDRACRISAASSTRATSAPPSPASSRCPRTSGRPF
jgi:cytochrome d ubiquinol oxidase subunit I